MMEGFHISEGYNWRKEAGNEKVILGCGMIVSEREVYLAVETLTPILQKRDDRLPNEEDVTTFILMLRGP